VIAEALVNLRQESAMLHGGHPSFARAMFSLVLCDTCSGSDRSFVNMFMPGYAARSLLVPKRRNDRFSILSEPNGLATQIRTDTVTGPVGPNRRDLPHKNHCDGKAWATRKITSGLGDRLERVPSSFLGAWHVSPFFVPVPVSRSDFLAGYFASD
jgi:hypothetical protein